MSSIKIGDIFNSRFSRRGRLDIIEIILTTSMKGSRRTNLIYKCNLSFNQLSNYLDFLLEKRLIDKFLIKKTSSYEVYKTTKKEKNSLKNMER
jgi:predicted transcriptional regulator